MNAANLLSLLCLSTLAASPETVSSQVAKGPVRLQVEVTPKSARLSDDITVAIRVEGPADFDIVIPVLPESWGDFRVAARERAHPRIDGATQIIEARLRLEPTASGDRTIEPVEIEFSDRHGNKKEYLESEPIHLHIDSPTAGDSLEGLRPTVGPIGPPTTGKAWWIVLGALALVAGLALVARNWKRRPRQPTGDRSLLELEQLVASGLAETDVKEFYVRVTGIVRRYLERTRGVRAPELTTEEFLREIAARGDFADDRERLSEFLVSADLVKFAALRPDATSVGQCIERAKGVLTRPMEKIAP